MLHVSKPMLCMKLSKWALTWPRSTLQYIFCLVNHNEKQSWLISFPKTKYCSSNIGSDFTPQRTLIAKDWIIFIYICYIPDIVVVNRHLPSHQTWEHRSSNQHLHGESISITSFKYCTLAPFITLRSRLTSLCKVLVSNTISAIKFYHMFVEYQTISLVEP